MSARWRFLSPGNCFIDLAGFVTAGVLPAAANSRTVAPTSVSGRRRPHWREGTPISLATPRSSLHLEGEQAIEEGAIPSKRLPQILGGGLVAV
jgi:hypothetical protein